MQVELGLLGVFYTVAFKLYVVLQTVAPEVLLLSQGFLLVCTGTGARLYCSAFLSSRPALQPQLGPS